MSDQVRVNNNMYDRSSVRVLIDGEPFYGIKSISYGDSIERSKGYGMGRHFAPRGRTRGKYSTDPVVISAEKETLRLLRASHAQRSTDQRTFGSARFPIVVQYVEPDGTPITDTIEDCMWAKNAAKSEDSTDPLYDDVELDCMRIKWNGLSLYDQSEGAP